MKPDDLCMNMHGQASGRQKIAGFIVSNNYIRLNYGNFFYAILSCYILQFQSIPLVGKRISLTGLEVTGFLGVYWIRLMAVDGK